MADYDWWKDLLIKKLAKENLYLLLEKVSDNAKNCVFLFKFREAIPAFDCLMNYK